MIIKKILRNLLLFVIALFTGFSILLYFLVRDNYQNIDFGAFANNDKKIFSTSQKDTSSVIKREVVQEESAVIDVINKAKPAVVSIVAERSGVDPFSGFYSRESGIGTGFLVKDGYVFTNRHVVDAELNYKVVLNDSKATFDVVEINKDPLNDFAILKINTNGGVLPYLELGDSDSIRVGQTVIAIGNALGELGNTASKGIVSGIGRTIETGDAFSGSEVLDNVIQTDAALNAGNSGGPLLDLSGKVVGINVARVINGDNLGFSIPVNSIKTVYEGFKQFGEIRRPYIGIEYRYLTKENTIYNRMPEGALILRIIPGSPADKSGLRRGDIITHVDNKRMDETTKISWVISKKNVGDEVTLKIDRDGSELNLKVKLESASNY